MISAGVFLSKQGVCSRGRSSLSEVISVMAAERTHDRARGPPALDVLQGRSQILLKFLPKSATSGCSDAPTNICGSETVRPTQSAIQQ